MWWRRYIKLVRKFFLIMSVIFSDVRRSSQTGESTGDRPAFSVSDRVRVTILLK